MQLFYNGCKITIVPVLKQFILMTNTKLFIYYPERRGEN